MRSIASRVDSAVSIHAPMKGATAAALERRQSLSGFNPRPHEGGDPPVTLTSAEHFEFQSTPP